MSEKIKTIISKINNKLRPGWLSFLIIIISISSILLEKKFTVKIYGQCNSPFPAEIFKTSAVNLVNLCIKFKKDKYIESVDYVWDDNRINFIIKERIPLLNWYNGEVMKSVDQDGQIINKVDDYEKYPTVKMPFKFDPRVCDFVLRFELIKPIKQILSIKPNIWKVEFMQNITIFTDRLEQTYSRVDKLIESVESDSVLQLFNPWKIFISKRY